MDNTIIVKFVGKSIIEFEEATFTVLELLQRKDNSQDECSPDSISVRC